MSGEASGLKKERKKSFFDAVLMAFGTLTSRILGLLRDMAFAALFDRSVTDAWTAASRIPNLFRRLFGEGSLAVSFIPVFTEARWEDSSGLRAKNFVNSFYALFLVVSASITLLLILFAEPLMAILLEARFQMDAAKFAMTVRMARVMLGFVFCVTTSAYFTAILNTFGSFGVAALAPTLFNVVLLIFTFLPPQWFPQYGDGLAWGVLVGGILQVLVLFFTLRAHDYMPRFRLQFSNEDLKKVLRLFLPGVVGLGLLQFMTLVNLHFASGLQEGTISAIYWADRLLEFPLSLISVSLGIALLPRLSDLWVQGKRQEMATTLEDHMLLNIFLALPAASGLYFLAEPIVRVLFERGNFGAQDVQTTTWILEFYSVLLFFVAMSRLVVVAYYAVQKALYPAVAVLGGLLVHLTLAPFFIEWWGLRGLIGSSAVAALVSLLFLLVPFKKLAVPLHWSRLARRILPMFIATVGMVLLLWQMQQQLNFAELDRPARAVFLASALVGAVSVYFILSWVLKVQEAQSTWAVLWQKLDSKIRR